MWCPTVKKSVCAAIASLSLLLPIEHAEAARVAAGTYIGSSATVTYLVDGVKGELSLLSNNPLVQIQPLRTPSRLQWKRITRDATQGTPTQIGDVSFLSESGLNTGAQSQFIEGFDPSEEVILIPTDSFLPGDLIFFHLQDEGLNHQPDIIETVSITIEGANGDNEIFEISADGPDSPNFYGFALAVGIEEAIPGDGRVATAVNTTIEALFVDEFDRSDNSGAVAIIDPRMTVFDALTGAPVNGAIVRVLDADTNEAMPILGTDATSIIGMSIVSGKAATDTSGRVYDVGDGEIRIPYLNPGQYQIAVEPPPGYIFASDVSNDRIAALPDSNFRLADAARGAVFDLPSGGTPRFDIPLDPRGSLQLTKTADDTDVAPGDFVRFRLILENNDDRAGEQTVISDVLPIGFRFVPGSLRLDDAIIDDPQVSDRGTELSIPVGPVPSGERRELTYIAQVGAQVRFGTVTGSATAQATGGFRSNRAEVVLTVVDELLSQSGTVLGRVVIGECRGPDSGEGIKARLYLETGKSIITDDDGRFHVDDLGTDAHALRLDEQSLPDDLVPHACPEYLRNGDTATARSIGVKGGLLRHVTFHLRRVERADDTASPETEAEQEEWTEDRLADLPKELRIVYPEDGASMDIPSLAIGITYPFGRKVTLFVNGEKVSNLSSHQTIANRKAGLAMRRWHGIDLPDGPSRIEATITDRTGRELNRIARTVHYVTDPVNAEIVPDLSTTIADGQSAPEIAIRITDDAGRPVHAGRRVPIIIAPPYQTSESFARFADDPLTERDSTRSMAEVGPDGIALVRLRPTSRAGEVDMTLQLLNRDQKLRAWLAPAPRPWILVGIADGTLGYNAISGNMVSAEEAELEDEIFSDGRMAFYAKGAIRGDWLLTLAYDSDKNRNPRDNDLFDRIDPNAFYPVYGDASTQEQTAPSRYPLFVRLERGQFFAMFGDYNTGMNRTELAAYERTLSGFKSVYEGDQFQVLAFAAEADQQFQRVELTADRGIGPYTLGVTDIQRNSETVRLLVREREQLDTVISEIVLAPFVDYTINYETGEVELQRAPSPADEAFNPAFLVVDFETDSPDPSQITVGGRAAVTLLDDTVEIGASAIHEEGGGIDASGDLVALDARASINDKLDVIAEIAASRTQEDGDTRVGTAYRAEATYAQEGWRARVYLKQSDADFGIAQQSVATRGRRTYGVDLRASIDDPLADKDDPDPEQYAVSGQIFRDEDLTSDSRRDQAEGTISRAVTYGKHGDGTVGIGLRARHDRLASGEKRSSHQLLGKASATILNGRAAVSIERNQTIANSGQGWEPDSTLARIRARVTDRVRATLGIEAFDGDSIDGANLHLGLSAEPWTGGRIDLGVNGLQTASEESGERIAATLGVAQDFKLTERLSMGLRLDHTQHLAGTDSPVVDSLFTAFRPAEEATNASAGIGYNDKGWSASVRVDIRRSDSSSSQRLAAGTIGDLTDDLTVAAAGTITNTDTAANGTSQGGTFTIGAAYRPAHRNLTGLHRLRAAFDTDGSDRATFINTMTVEGKPTQWLTLAAAHGVRFRLQDLDGSKYESITQFFAADAYFRLAQNWDFGIHGNALVSLDGNAAYSYGASLGYSPRPGITVRAGYNLDGFDDEDFSEANATAQGPFVNLTIRFDENDIQSILPDAGWINDFTGAVFH